MESKLQICKMIKAGIIEDNNTLRNSLTHLINATSDMQCVVSLSNLLNVVSEIKKNEPEIILMDIGLPNISGIEGVQIFKENFEHIEVLMFTVFDDEEKIFEAIKAGASGYLLKKTPPAEILEAIRSLHQGGAPMSAGIARKVIQSFHDNKPSVRQTFNLTTREHEILNSLVEGLSYKKIMEK